MFIIQFEPLVLFKEMVTQLAAFRSFLFQFNNCIAISEAGILKPVMGKFCVNYHFLEKAGILLALNIIIASYQEHA